MKAFLILHFIVWALIVFVCSFGIMMWSGYLPPGFINAEFVMYAFFQSFIISLPGYAIGRLASDEFHKRFKRI